MLSSPDPYFDPSSAPVCPNVGAAMETSNPRINILIAFIVYKVVYLLKPRETNIACLFCLCLLCKSYFASQEKYLLSHISGFFWKNGCKCRKILQKDASLFRVV
jgi:hypothetical protein